MDTEIVVALIGVAGVAGTIGGAVVGSRIQAGGGHAQAEAARDAAVTAAMAAQHQALRELRWPVLSAYLRAASELHEATDELFSSGSEEAETVLTDSRRSYGLAHAEAEIAVPDSVRQALGDFHESLSSSLEDVRLVSRALQGHRALKALRTRSPEARRAELALGEMRNEPTGNYFVSFQMALHAVPGLASADRNSLLVVADFRPQDWRAMAFPHVVQEERRQAYVEQRAELIGSIRTALGTAG